MPDADGAEGWLDSLRGDHAPCPQCGYDRRGLVPRSPCPECGCPPEPSRALVVQHGAAASTPSGWTTVRRVFAGTFLVCAAVLWLVAVPGIPSAGLIIVLPALGGLLAGTILLTRAVRRRAGGPSARTSFSAVGIASRGRASHFVSWRTVRGVRADGSTLILDRSSLWAGRHLHHLSLRPAQVARLAEEIDALRWLAVANPSASPATLPVAQRCHSCGAAQRPNDPSRTCETCGEAYEPAFRRFLPGRSSPGVFWRALATPVAFVAVGLVGGGWLLTSRMLLPVIAATIIILYSLAVARRAWSLLREGRSFADSAWIIRTDRLELFGPATSVALAWNEIEDVVAHRPVRGWRPLELRVRADRGEPRTIWVDERATDVDELRSLLLELRRGATGGATHGASRLTPA